MESLFFTHDGVGVQIISTQFLLFSIFYYYLFFYYYYNYLFCISFKVKNITTAQRTAELMDTNGVLLNQNTKWTINTAFALESKYFNQSCRKFAHQKDFLFFLFQCSSNFWWQFVRGAMCVSVYFSRSVSIYNSY